MLRHLARAGLLALAQHGEIVGKRRHLVELVADHQHGKVATHGHLAHQAQHLLRLARRQHRGGLVQHEEGAAEIELLDDLQLLLLAGRHLGHLGVERQLERHRFHELGKLGALLAPVDDARHVLARNHEVLRPGQRRHEREMLVDHAKPQRRRVLRACDRNLVAIDRDLSRCWVVEAHHAFDERRLAGAVFAQQRVERARRHLDRHVVQRREAAEAHGHADGLDADRLARAGFGERRDPHGSFSTKALEFDTAPNTPPCILIILIAARWLP